MKFYQQISVMILIILSAALCHSKTIIKIGYVEFPPMTFTNAEKKPDGVLISMADKVLSRLGYDWAAYPFPAKRLAKSLANGHIDLWIGLSTLPEFEGTTYVSKSIVCKLSLRAYTTGKNPPIYNREDLSGKTIIIIRGYSYGGWIGYIKDAANQISFIEVNNSHEEAFRKLARLRDLHQKAYLLDYKYPSEAVLKKIAIPDLQFNEVNSLDVRFVVSRKTRNSKKLLDQLENTYLELKAEGEI